MDAKTLEALKGSVAKWEAIVAGTGEDHGQMNCPLCYVFIIGDCEGCPVMAATGKRFCAGTPYEAYYESAKRSDAADELAFLKSLLPQDV